MPSWFPNNGLKLQESSLTILRVAAIYGPGRIPIERLQRGFVFPPERQIGYTNRIHVDDLVQVCLAASMPNVSGVFNVADGCPMRMNQYFNLVAEIWGLPFVTESSDETDLAHISGPMWSYLRSSRRIDNQRHVA